MTESFFSLLQAVPGDRPCLYQEEGMRSYAEVLDEAQALRRHLRLVRTQCVVLQGLSARELIPALLALDGEVEAVLLLPSSLPAAWHDALVFQAECSHRFVGGALEALPSAPMSPSFSGRTRWLLATSGTTGKPKLIEHDLASLVHRCQRDGVRGGEFVWGLLYDPVRFAGLQVLLQALLAGSALGLMDGLPIERQVTLLLQYRVNALSATPSLWRRLLMDERSALLPLRQVTLGGEIADAAILQALRNRYPQARLIHIYASTEAGIGFTVRDGLPGFPARWLGTGEAGGDLRIRDDGHLLIKPKVASGGSEVSQRVDSEGYLDTGDLVLQQGERVLFLGRGGGVINVGGNKVSPEHIESFLRTVAGIMDARVSGRRNSMMGQLVVAELVVSPGSELSSLRREVLRQCRAGLERWQVPALLEFVESLPETPAGKRERIVE